MRAISTLPLYWPALCTHVRRAWLRDHRGDLPAKPGTAAPVAPVAIAACAQFGERHSFATEAEAETFRWVAPRAQNAVQRWRDLRYDRDNCRISVACIRDWVRTGDKRQVAICRAEFRQRWAVYRASMRAMGVQVGWVRDALTPRKPTHEPTLAIAAE